MASPQPQVSLIDKPESLQNLQSPLLGDPSSPGPKLVPTSVPPTQQAEEETENFISPYPAENWGPNETEYWEAERKKEKLERKQARAEKRSKEDIENPPRFIKDLKEKIESWEQPHLTSRSFPEEVGERQFSNPIPLTHKAVNPHTKTDPENRRRLCVNLYRQLCEEIVRAKECGVWGELKVDVKEDAEAAQRAGVGALEVGGVMEIDEERVREILRHMIGARRAKVLQ